VLRDGRFARQVLPLVTKLHFRFDGDDGFFNTASCALAELRLSAYSIAPLAKLPHVMFFGGGVVIKLGDEVIGSIGASDAPGAKLDDGCAHSGLDKIRDQLK